MSYRSGRILVVLIWFSLILTSSSLVGQEPERSDIEGVVYSYIKNYFPDTYRTISSIKGFDDINIDEVYLVELEPEGWFLVSGDRRAEAVLAFSTSGDFNTGENIPDNPVISWIASYSDQINFVKGTDNAQESRTWDYNAGRPDDSRKADLITVSPLIDVEWNQGSGWNALCPEDSEGPGGHAYAGCVAVAMAQAMSVYTYPLNGKGSHSYYHPVYGTLSVNYDNADYKWDEISPTSPDIGNQLLLYNCAIGVNMNFGPTSSGATSSSIPETMRSHFQYSKLVSYQSSSNFTELSWKKLLVEELESGHPLIYRGEPLDGSSAHAFNIDGVLESNMFHLNWGWGGKNNGYYLLTALSPGTRDYSYRQGAVIRIKPYYYPTNLFLSNYIVPEDEDAGAIIGTILVIDEATDNQYEIIVNTDSTLVGDNWVNDYWLDGNILKTGKSYPAGGIDRDTVWFNITDIYGNNLDVEAVLLFSGALPVELYENINEDILIYPNPSSGIVSFSSTNDQPVKGVTIYSSGGMPVMSLRNPLPSSVIDLSPLSPGIYIMEVEWLDGSRARRKVVKN